MPTPALIEKKLAQYAITGSVAAAYTVPASTTGLLKAMEIVNTNASTTVTLDLYLVPSGGSATTATQWFSDLTLVPGEVVQWTGLQILEEGDALHAGGDTTGCTLNLSGGERS